MLKLRLLVYENNLTISFMMKQFKITNQITNRENFHWKYTCRKLGKQMY